MQVTVNGELVDLEDEMSIAEFLRFRAVAVTTIAVEYNQRLTKREDWTRIVIKENDRLEVVQILGGG